MADIGYNEGNVPVISNSETTIDFQFDFDTNGLTYTRDGNNLIIAGYGNNEDMITLLNFNFASISANTDTLNLYGGGSISIKEQMIIVSITASGSYEAGAYNENITISGEEAILVTLSNLNKLKDTVTIEGVVRYADLEFSRTNNSSDVVVSGGGHNVKIEDFFTRSMTGLTINGTSISNSQKISVSLTSEISEYEPSNYAEELMFASGANITVSGLTASDIIKLANPTLTRRYGGLTNNALEITGVGIGGSASLTIEDFFTDNKCDTIYDDEIKSIKDNYKVNVILAADAEYSASEYDEIISAAANATVSGLSAKDKITTVNAAKLSRTAGSNALVIKDTTTNKIITVSDFFLNGVDFLVNTSSTSVLNITVDLNNTTYEGTKYNEIITGTGHVSNLSVNDRIKTAGTLTRNYDGVNNDKLTIGNIVIDDFFTTNACTKFEDESLISAQTLNVVLSNSQTYYAANNFNEIISGSGTIVASSLDVENDKIVVGGTSFTYSRINNSSDVTITGSGVGATTIIVQGFFNLNDYLTVNNSPLTSSTVINVNTSENYTATSMYKENITADGSITVSNLTKGSDTLTIGGDKTYSRVAGSNALVIESTNGKIVTISDFFADYLANELTIDDNESPINSLSVTLNSANPYEGTKYNEIISGQGSVSNLKIGKDTINLGENDYTLKRTYDGTNNDILKVNYDGKTISITDFFDEEGSDIIQINGVNISSKSIAVDASRNYAASDDYKENITVLGNITVSNLSLDDTIRIDGAYQYNLDGSDLKVKGRDYTVTLADYFADTPKRPESIKDSSNSIVDLSSKTLIVSGISDFSASNYSMFGAFNVTGTAEADSITDSTGDDILAGNGGNDTFIFNASSGKDTITDANEGDVIKFIDVAKENIEFLIKNQDLLIKYGTNSELTISDFFTSNNRINEFWALDEPEGTLTRYMISEDASIDYVLSNNERLDVAEIGFNMNISIKAGTEENPTRATIYGLGAKDNIKITGTASLSRVWGGNKNDQLTITDSDNHCTINISDYFMTYYGKFNGGNMPVALNVELINAQSYVADNYFNEIISGIGTVSNLGANDQLLINNGESAAFSRNNSGALVVSGGSDSITIPDFDFTSAATGNIKVNGQTTSASTVINVTLDNSEDYAASAYVDHITVKTGCTITGMTKGTDELVIDTTGAATYSRIAGNNNLSIAKGAINVILTDFFETPTLNGSEIGGADGTSGMTLYVALNSTNDYIGTRYSEILSLAADSTTANVSGLKANDGILLADAILSRAYSGDNDASIALTVKSGDNSIIVTDFFNGNLCDTLNGESLSENNIIHTTLSGENTVYAHAVGYKEAIDGVGTITGITANDYIDIIGANLYRVGTSNTLRIYDGDENDIKIANFDFTTANTTVKIGGNTADDLVKFTDTLYVNLNGQAYSATGYNEVFSGSGSISGISADDNIDLANAKYYRTGNSAVLSISNGTNTVNITDFNFGSENTTVKVGGELITYADTIYVALNGDYGAATGYIEEFSGNGTVGNLGVSDRLIVNCGGETAPTYALNGTNLTITGTGDDANTIVISGYNNVLPNVYLNEYTAFSTPEDLSLATLTVSGINEYSAQNKGFGKYVILGTDDADTLTGGMSTDTITGGIGDDDIYGNYGTASDNQKDIFIFNEGDGADTIYNADNSDVIRITKEIENPASVLDFSMDVDNSLLTITGYGENDSITVNYDARDRENSINTVEVYNGEGYTTLNIEDYAVFNINLNDEAFNGVFNKASDEYFSGLRVCVSGEGVVSGLDEDDIIKVAETSVSYTRENDGGLVINDVITVSDFFNENSNDFTVKYTGGSVDTADAVINVALSEDFEYTATDYNEIYTGVGTITGITANDYIDIIGANLYRVGTSNTLRIYDGDENDIKIANFDFTTANTTVKIGGNTADDLVKFTDTLYVNLNGQAYSATNYVEVFTGSGSITALGANDAVIFDGAITDSLTCIGDALTVSDGANAVTVTDYFTNENARSDIYKQNSTSSVDLTTKHLVVSGRNNYDNAAFGFASVNITGTAGNDNFIGSANADIIEAKAGTDTIAGGLGTDTFIFNKGDGDDVITDASSDDMIKFNGYTDFSDIEFNKDGKNLVISYNKSEDEYLNSITVNNYFVSEAGNDVSATAINKFMLGNSQYNLEWRLSNVDNKYHMYNIVDGSAEDNELAGVAGIRSWIQGGNGDDFITGANQGDILAGDNDGDIISSESGNAELYGASGADDITANGGGNFVVGGSDNDTITVSGGNNTIMFINSSELNPKAFGEDAVSGTTSTDILKFSYSDGSEGYKFSELRFDRVANNLIITGESENNKVTLDNFFTANSKVDTVLALDENGDQQEFSILQNAIINVDIMGTTKENPHRPCAGYREMITGSGFIEKINQTVNLVFANETSYRIGADGLLSITDGSTTIKITDYNYALNPVLPNVYVGETKDDLSAKSLTVTGLDTFNGENLPFKDYTITGTASNDNLAGGSGNDIIAGNGRNDTFIFGEDAGYDRITDANTGDRIKFTSATFVDITFSQGTGEEDSPITSLFVEYGENIIEIENYFTALNQPSNNAIKLFNIGNKDYTLGWKQSDIDGSWGMYNVIEGTEGDDEITAVEGIKNWIAGGAGSDTITGLNEYDMLSGGSGDDTIIASDEDTQLYGEDGNDKLYGGEGDDKLFGGEGDDILTAGAGDNELTGGAGADTFIFSSNDDGENVILDGKKEDIIRFNDVKWKQLKFIKNDKALVIKYGDNKVTIADYYTENGSIAKEDAIDIIYTSESKKPHSLAKTGILINRESLYNKEIGFYEEMLGTEADDELVASAKVNSWVQGANGNDTIKGSAKYNVLNGDVGDDLIYGGSDTDEIYGGVGNDELYGNDGNDIIHGGNYSDILNTQGSGNDTINGGKGNDIIIGGDGDDVITGGVGADTFVYTLNTNTGVSFGADEIADADREDTISLRLTDYTDEENPILKNAGILTKTSTGNLIESVVDLRGQRIGDNLIITAKHALDDDEDSNVSGTIKLDNFFKNASSKNIDTINLGVDETTGKAINYSILKQMEVDVAFAEDSTEYIGSDYNENIDVSGGSALKMGKGKNTVTIKSGYSGDTVITLTSGEKTNLIFEDGADELTYDKGENGKDLVITLANGSTVTIQNYISNNFDANITIQGNELYTCAPDLFSYGEKDVDSKKSLVASSASDYIDVSEYISNSSKGVSVNSKAGNDNITGSYYNDTITSNLGDNTIKEYYGTNKITTGKGDDTISALENSSNKITSKGGNNNVKLESIGKNSVKLGSGNDTLLLNSGVNSVKAGNGLNYIMVGSEALVPVSINNVTTGKGADTFDIYGGTNIINSGKGSDAINLFEGNNTVKSAAGNNVVTIGKEGMDGTSLINKIITGKGKDTYIIQNGYNVINSGAGNDKFEIASVAKSDGISPTTSYNIINAGKGNDKFEISSGNNNINGGAGNDTYIFNDGGLSTKIKDTSGNDTYDFSNVSIYDNMVTISDTEGKNTLILDELKEFYFDVKLNKKEKGVSGNSIIFTDLNDSTMSNGIKITGRKAIATIKTEGEEVGELESYKFDLTVINTITQNVAGWLKENGYKSTADVFNNEKQDGDIADLLSLYADTADAYLQK